jgi:peptidoglycan pentaglycine glycine transferase (the first glycine)
VEEPVTQATDRSAPPGAGESAGRGVEIVDATAWAAAAWDEVALRSERGEAFQSHAWGELKRDLGWTASRYVVELDGRRIAAISLQERPLGHLPGPVGRLRILYGPHGPVLLEAGVAAAEAALEGLRLIARQRRALVLMVDPQWEEEGELAPVLRRAGFRPARREIQVSRTGMLVSLRADEAEQRAALGHTTAYDIGKARQAGVAVERLARGGPGMEAGLAEFFEMHAATGRREGFLVRDRDYELRQWRALVEAEVAALWFAGVGGLRQTGALVLRSGARLVYYAAGSVDDADLRRTRANHLLQWEIIRWAAGNGFATYDMGGVDTRDHPGIPADESHPLWNLYLFKRRFGARGILYVRAHEYCPGHLSGPMWRVARLLRSG